MLLEKKTNKKKGDVRTRIHGGPQKEIWSPNYVLIVLILLSISVFCLIVYAVLQDNVNLIAAQYRHYFCVKLLDLKTAFSIFISLIGLLLVRHHFLIGFMPRLVYETKKIKKSSFDAFDFGEDIWQVKVRNVGLGAATILKYNFRLDPTNLSEKPYTDDYYTIIDCISKLGIELETSYYLEDVTPGYTLPAKEEMILFEMKISDGKKIKQLDLVIEFSGLLGGKYAKEIFLLPRLGLISEIRLPNDSREEG